MAENHGHDTSLIQEVGRLRSRIRQLEQVLRKTEREARQSQDRYKLLYYNCPLPYQSLGPDGHILEINDAWLKTLGYQSHEVLGKWFGEFLIDEEQSIYRERFEAFKQTGKVQVTFHLVTRNGEILVAQFSGTAAYDDKGKFIQSHCIFQDVTQHQFSQGTLILTNRILTVSQKQRDITRVCDEAVRSIQEFLDCACVGIRLLDADRNIPYVSYVGFPESFYNKESLLSIDTDACMCIEVIKGTLDSALPFATMGGSFFMNGTSRFLATVSDADKGETRNVCNQYGYESVALIPICDNGNILGLIHLADTRENRVPENKVRVVETVALQLGTTIKRLFAEKDLAEKHATERALLDASTESAILIDKDATILAINKIGAERLSSTPESLIGVCAYDLLPPELAQSRRKKLQKAVETRKSIAFKDVRGDYVLEQNICPVYTSDGYIDKLAIYAQDVSEYEASRRNHEESEERFRVVFNKSFQFSLILDPKGTILEMNDLCYVVCGPLADQSIGIPLWEASWWKEFPEVQEKTKDAIQRAQEMESIQDEVVFLDYDRNMHHGIRNFSPIQDDNGRLAYISVVGLDVTDRVQLNEQLAKSEGRLKAIFDTTHDLICITDEQVNTIWANPAWHTIFGSVETERSSPFELVHPEDRDLVAKAWQALIEEDTEIQDVEYRFLTPEGDYLYFETSACHLPGPDKSRYLVVAHEVTQRKEAEQALRNIEWLLTKRKRIDEHDGKIIPDYGDLTSFNSTRVIFDAVDSDILENIVYEYLDLLDGSAAIYEANGDYVIRIQASGYCRLLDEASRALCHTDDNQQALNSGLWHCHESCWSQASVQSIESGEPIEIKCAGGMHIYAIPIWADGDIVGSINIGYGPPTHDEETLQSIAQRYQIDYEILLKTALQYKTRPPYIVDLAKRRVHAAARLLGALVEQNRARKLLAVSEGRNRALVENFPNGAVILFDHDLRYLLADGRGLAEVGLDKAAMVGKTIFEIFPEETWRVLEPDYREVLKGHERSRKMEYEDHIYQVQMVPVYNDQEVVIAGITMTQDITEAQRNMETLRMQSWVLDQIQDCVTVTDLNGIITYVNDAQMHVQGYAREALVGQHVSVYGDPEEGPTQRELVEMTLRDGQWIGCLKNRTVEGEDIYIDCHTQLIHDTHRRPVAMCGIATDITKRVQNELRLKQLISDQQVLLDSDPSFIIYKDTENNIIKVSKTVADMTGLPREEIEGKPSKSIYPDMADQYYQDDLEVMRSTEPKLGIIEPLTTVEGETKWLLTNKVPVKDAEGKVTGIVVCSVDITALKEAEQKYRLLFEGMIDGFASHEMIFDEQGQPKDYRFLAMNPAFEHLTGLKASDLVGHTVLEIMPQTESHWIQTYGEVVSTGEPVRFEHFAGAIDKYFEVVAYRTQPGEFACIFVDVTDRKKAEKRLLDYQNRLKALAKELTLTEEREKRSLAEALHDDVQQDLAYSRLGLRMLEEGVQEEEVRADIAKISGVINNTIESIRSLTFNLNLQVLKDLGLEKALAAWLRDQVQIKHRIETTFDVNGSLPSLEWESEAILFRSIRELLANAVKHGRPNTIAVHMGIELSTLRVTIQDDGCGFNPAILDGENQPKGFGLFSIRERIEPLGGTLVIHSHDGGGAKVTLAIPIDAES